MEEIFMTKAQLLEKKKYGCPLCMREFTISNKTRTVPFTVIEDCKHIFCKRCMESSLKYMPSGTYTLCIYWGGVINTITHWHVKTNKKRSRLHYDRINIEHVQPVDVSSLRRIFWDSLLEEIFKQFKPQNVDAFENYEPLTIWKKSNKDNF